LTSGNLKRGFTLLEVMVATVIMAIAVAGVMTAMSTSMRNAARLTAYDRAVMLSRSKMDELLVDQRIPPGAAIEGTFDDNEIGTDANGAAGWQARFTNFDLGQPVGPGSPILERVELEIWWMSGGQRYSFPLEGYRRAIMPAPPQ
jgi:general secretion pathway protein I